MKRTFKKSLSLVLAILMVFAVMPIAGAADHTHVYNQYETVPSGKGHWSKCSCGELDYGSYEACSGGAATCQSGAICDYCKTEYTEPSGAHVQGDIIIDDIYLAAPANCTNRATYYYPCAVCEEPIKDGNVFFAGKVDPDNHQYIYAVSNGNKTHNAKCGFENCNAEVKNVPCSDAEPVVTPATCTVNGKTEYTCDVCSYKWSEPITAAGHNYTKESGVPRSEATCTAYNTYWYACANEGCNANAKDDANATDKFYNGTSKLNHVYNQEVKSEFYLSSSATCQQKAAYFKSCVCGAKGTETFLSDKGECKFVNYVYNQDATCTKNGTESAPCVYGCGNVDTREKADTQLDHVFTRREPKDDRIYQKGNCQTPNSYYVSCTTCDAYTENAKFTSTIMGECDFTGEEITESNYLALNKTPATCTELAVFYRYCTVCGASSKGTAFESTFATGSTLAHTYTKVKEDKYIRVNATCDVGAIYSKSCSVCGIAKVAEDVDVKDTSANVSPDDIFYGDPLGHNLQSVKAYKDSTCALEGNTEKFECKNVFSGQACSHSVGGEVIEKKAHEYKVTQEFRYPTCKTNGQYGQKKCDGCGVIITFDENGDTVLVPSLDMTAKGHVDSDGDMICDKCDALLEAEDLCTCICHKGESGGIMYFVVWILKWFWKLTSSNEYCECGALHY